MELKILNSQKRDRLLCFYLGTCLPNLCQTFFYTQLIFSPAASNAEEVHTTSHQPHRHFLYFVFTIVRAVHVGEKMSNQAPDPKLAFYSERWGQRCIVHILVHNTEAKLFSEVSPV